MICSCTSWVALTLIDGTSLDPNNITKIIYFTIMTSPYNGGFGNLDINASPFHYYVSGTVYYDGNELKQLISMKFS